MCSKPSLLTRSLAGRSPRTVNVPSSVETSMSLAATPGTSARRTNRSFSSCKSTDGLQAVVLVTAGCEALDRKSTRLNSSHLVISYAVFCLKKKKKKQKHKSIKFDHPSIRTSLL